MLACAPNGTITPQYKAALKEHKLRAYHGDDASSQPGNLQDLMLHEMVVAWVRRREKMKQPLHPEKETPAQYATRLRGICKYINEKYDVAGLCRQLPGRLQTLVDREGDRIGK